MIITSHVGMVVPDDYNDVLIYIKLSMEEASFTLQPGASALFTTSSGIFLHFRKRRKKKKKQHVLSSPPPVPHSIQHPKSNRKEATDEAAVACPAVNDIEIEPITSIA